MLAIAEEDPFRVMFHHGGAPVAAYFAEDGLWHVQTDGVSAASLFLDYAVAEVLDVQPATAVQIATAVIRRLGPRLRRASAL